MLSRVSFKRFVTGATVAAATVLAASSASAVPTFGSISTAEANDGVNPIFGTDTRNGWFSATLYLVGGPADITVSYLGAEAGFVNNFTFDTFSVNTPGTGGWNTTGATSTTLFNVASGALDFTFNSALPGSISNASGNNDAGSNPNFFVTFEDENAAGGQIAWLWLDDGGAGNDDNHDDMVIKLAIKNGTFTTNPNDPAPGETPIPGAAFLFLSGIAGVGMLRLKAKRAAKKAAA